MKLVALAGIAVFMLTSLVVGLRVLALWWRTRKLPELLLAIALLCVGFFAFAVGTAGKLLIEATFEVRSGLTLLGLVTEYTGTAALIAFAWRVFHPRESWAAAFTALLVCCMIGAATGEILSGEYMRYSDPQQISGPWVPLGLAARGAGPTWMAFECFRYFIKLRRRLQLGLAEPLVVHRVALWGIGIGASALAYVGSISHRLVYGTGLREHVWAISGISVLAMISAVSIFVAFFPPSAYRRWAQGSSEPPRSI